MAKIQRIHWIEDQPAIRSARLKIEESGLIQDLVSLVETHGLKGVHGNKLVGDVYGKHLYLVSVGKSPDLKYYVSIERTDIGTKDAFGEIYFED